MKQLIIIFSLVILVACSKTDESDNAVVTEFEELNLSFLKPNGRSIIYLLTMKIILAVYKISALYLKPMVLLKPKPIVPLNRERGYIEIH